MNFYLIPVAAIAAFLASSVYYVIFGKTLAALLPADSVAVDMRKGPGKQKEQQRAAIGPH